MSDQITISKHEYEELKELRQEHKQILEEIEDLREWMQILSDPVFRRGIAKGLKEAKEKKGIPFQEFKRNLTK